MNVISRRCLFLALTASLFALSTGSAMAEEGQWAKNHPRRVEVNKRLAHQDKRIDHKVKNGEITQQQADQLHKEDQQIRQEERDMASHNKGHLTKADQKSLNQQENAVSKQIGK